MASRMKRYRDNDIKNTILALIFLSIVLMTAGYAAYSRQLVIDVTSTVNSDWEVLFTDVKEAVTTRGSSELSPPKISLDGLSMTMDIQLTYTDDEISYELEITNFSRMFDAEYTGVVISNNNDDFIKYEILGINVEDKIKADITDGLNPNKKRIVVKAFWNPDLVNEIPDAIPYTESRTITLAFAAIKPQ